MKLIKQLAMIATLGLLSSASFATEPGRWERFKDYAHTEKEAAVADGKKVLAEFDAKIDDMKKKSTSAKGEAKAAYERNLADLRAKRADADKHLEHMKKSGKDAWHATREGFAKAHKDLHQAYEKAAADIKK